MFSRGAISRSFNAPHGMRINQAAGAVREHASRILRKSFSTGRLRHSSSEGALSRQPVILKEGYMTKPSFFRFGGRKRRWCVLRKFSATEASIDLYVDDSKNRYKGSISLDNSAGPILIVKNADKKQRRMSRQCYIVIKVGKGTFQFTCDSFRELKEWCALIRQAMDVGNTFSGVITEPASIADGPVNIKFTSNCISVMCPIKETSIKTWLLHKVTTFGQCGGIFTFEVCLQCSDSSTTVSRCSINLLQEKPIIILNVLERAIRNNPNTNEIHYERSILGDIYHCDHDCAQPGRLMPAYSDPNIFSSAGSFSPPRTPLEATIEVHTTDQRESTDSGLPGTPQPEELSIASTGIPSPTSSFRSNVFRSPHHQPRYLRSPSADEQERNSVFRRRQSDETPSRLSKEMPSSPSYTTVRTFDHSPSKLSFPNNGHVQYVVIDHGAPMKLVRPAECTQETHQTVPSVPFIPPVNTVETDTFPVNTTEQVPREKRNNYNKLKTLQESTEAVDDVIYDVPNCEFLTDPVFPASAPAHSYMDAAATRSPSYPTLSPSSPNNLKVSPSPSPDSRSPTHAVQGPLYNPTADRKDREEDYEDAWVSPILGRKVKMGQPCVSRPKNIHAHRETGSRRRFQSSSDVLDVPTTTNLARRERTSDQNAATQRNRPQSATLNDRHLEKASNDFLQRLNEEEEKLSKVLAASRREKNEELGGDSEVRDRLSDLNRPYMFNLDDLDHDYADPDTILETCSNLVDYHSSRSQHSYLAGRMLALTKEPTNNIKGYAYKVTIPFTNTQYDVPRRAAAAPDLTTMSHDAPPKPKRHTSTEHLYFVH